MIRGVVNDQSEATIRLLIVGMNGRSHEVTAVLDTGYNGMITLPISIVSGLSLSPSASREVTLGDNGRKVFPYFTADVIWAPFPARHGSCASKAIRS